MKKHVNCITVNTDASFHPKYKVGGYAFYIICDSFRVQSGGCFKIEPKTPIEAEMMCMANALHTLLNHKDLPTTGYLVINSDCLFAFEKIKRNSKNPIGKLIAKLIREIRLKTSRRSVMPKFDLRHVKAHSGKNDSRSFVNEWCDKEAKKWMYLKVKKSQQQ